MEEFFAFVGLVTPPITIGFAVAWWLTRGELRRLRAQRRGRRLPAERARSEYLSGDAAPDDRLERLERAVDAIAVEVERIAEGQRFTTKLLAERGSADRPGARQVVGHVTPH